MKKEISRVKKDYRTEVTSKSPDLNRYTYSSFGTSKSPYQNSKPPEMASKKPKDVKTSQGNPKVTTSTKYAVGNITS